MNAETPTQPTDAHVDASPPDAGAESRYRRKGGRSTSGAALVARGESMVWLTAGSLAICIVMIVGLLVLVFLQGVSTFRAVPLVRFELADGTVHLGEVSRSESYELLPSMLDDMPEPIAERARKLLPDPEDSGEFATVKRRLVRTGNNDITRKHFDWVDDFAVVEETEPEWAVVLERLEYGRFYGTPVRLESRIERKPSGDEERLTKLLFFFSPVNVESLEESDRTEVEAGLEMLRAKLAEVQRKGIETFRSEVKESASEAATVFAEVEGVGDVPFDEYEIDAGNLVAVRRVWESPEVVWPRFEELHPEAVERYEERRDIEEYEVGEVNRLEEAARLRVRKAEIDTKTSLVAAVERVSSLQVEIDGYREAVLENDRMADRVRQLLGGDSPLVAAAKTIAETLNADYAGTLDELETRQGKIEKILDDAPQRARSAVEEYFATKQESGEKSRDQRRRIDAIKAENEQLVLVVETSQEEQIPIVVRDIVRGYPANQLTGGEKWGVYWSRWWEFLSADPRFANQEGGVFPAIWGTMAMTIIMSLAVVPFGVLAALYLREYAKAGPIVSAVRIAVNNLAGVPSIVFGVFGLGFFCYIIGAYVDGGPTNAGIVPFAGNSPAFLGSIAVLAVTAVGAFFLGITSNAGGPTAPGSSWKLIASRLSFLLWIVATIALVVVLAKLPEFHGFFRAKLPNPTFGKGGLLWASLTLALLTLPVVIVATEEALAAVPNSMREGSYACGASKWQTIQRIVLPRAMPGITTGMILAMARGAGEVAPLMLVGALKLAPELPVDGVAPFVHLDRSFMHLGFHIFDLGFQSQNSEAAKPMVFTTTLLLITLVAMLNVAAIVLRARLRRKFKGSQF